MVEHSAVNRRVASSSLACGANPISDLGRVRASPFSSVTRFACQTPSSADHKHFFKCDVFRPAQLEEIGGSEEISRCRVAQLRGVCGELSEGAWVPGS